MQTGPAAGGGASDVSGAAAGGGATDVSGAADDLAPARRIPSVELPAPLDGTSSSELAPVCSLSLKAGTLSSPSM